MTIDVFIECDDYKKGFCDALLHIIRIIKNNNDIQQNALIDLLNAVKINIDKEAK